MRWFRRHHRIPFALALAAWVGAQLLTVVHQLETEHAVCSEHGEIVELDGPTVDAASQDLAAQDLAAQDGPPSQGEGDDDDHEHGCDWLPSAQVDALAISSGVGAFAADEPGHTTATHTTEQARGPPLRWAPKTSPPHRA